MSGAAINTVIDVESLAASMEEKIMSNQLRFTPKCCIFRTPTILSRHNKEAYVPEYFSFGPFHHSQPNLQASKEIKLQYLREVLGRFEGSSDAVLKECLDSINQVKEKARACYAENLNRISDPEFVEMMVVDGCFIIELFRREAKAVPYEEDDDPVSSMSCMYEYLQHDLFLLENQIPWLVLVELFGKTKGPKEAKSLVELALYYFSDLFPAYQEEENDASCFKKKEEEEDIVDLIEKEGIEIKHIIDLLRWSLVLPLKMEESDESKLYPIRCATRLVEAGVTFVRAKKPKSILQIKYKQGGVVEIPHLLIDESTETLFRNLISYEQCKPNCETLFTSYAKIMDNLIDTQNDMEILCQEEVFDNWLSPQDAAQFFNELYNDACVKESLYYPLCENLHQHCNRWVPKWRAALVHNYFTKPWAIVAIIYATIMLFLTFLQVFLN